MNYQIYKKHNKYILKIKSTYGWNVYKDTMKEIVYFKSIDEVKEVIDTLKVKDAKEELILELD